MKFKIIAFAGFGQEGNLLGFSDTPLASKPSHWQIEEITEKEIEDYEKWNGKARWFTCGHCKRELIKPMQRPFSCSYGHLND
jgi:hypothetical protein